MNSPLYINVLFRPLHGGGAVTNVSASGEVLAPVLGQGMREYSKIATLYKDGIGAPETAPFNATFVDIRRLWNLTPEQAEEIEKEYAIRITPLPGSNAPSMGG